MTNNPTDAMADVIRDVDAALRMLHTRDAAELVLTRLAAAGWQLVPKAITEEMADELCPEAFDTAQECWESMLKAAPGGSE